RRQRAHARPHGPHGRADMGLPPPPQVGGAGMRKAFGAYTLLVLVVLYAPIAVMIGFSFNESKYLRWTGFTLDWYRRMADNRDLKSALVTTLILAAVATVAATVLGTMAALAARKAFRGKQLYTTLVSLPVMVPDIVLAI